MEQLIFFAVCIFAPAIISFVWAGIAEQRSLRSITFRYVKPDRDTSNVAPKRKSNFVQFMPYDPFAQSDVQDNTGDKK